MIIFHIMLLNVKYLFVFSNDFVSNQGLKRVFEILFSAVLIAFFPLWQGFPYPLNTLFPCNIM